MKVYTKTGDTGTTALFGGTRVPKDHIRIESYGTIDELNSWIGLIRDQEINPTYKEILIEVQDRLFTAGAILATPPDKEILKNGNILKDLMQFVNQVIEKIFVDRDMVMLKIEEILLQWTYFLIQ